LRADGPDAVAVEPERAHDLDSLGSAARQTAPTAAYLVTEEDKIRRETIMRTMCDLSLDFDAMSQALGIDFERHFAKELASLAPLEADGLVARTSRGLTVTDAGRLFIRNVAMCFDDTLAPLAERTHSKTI